MWLSDINSRFVSTKQEHSNKFTASSLIYNDSSDFSKQKMLKIVLFSRCCRATIVAWAISMVNMQGLKLAGCDSISIDPQLTILLTCKISIDKCWFGYNNTTERFLFAQGTEENILRTMIANFAVYNTEYIVIYIL